MDSLGEVLAYRELEASGESRYVTGQHGARLVAPRRAHLTYVDHSGHLIMMPCALDERDAWYPMGQIVRVPRLGRAEAHPVTVDFVFSATMLHHLEKAQSRWSAQHG